MPRTNTDEAQELVHVWQALAAVGYRPGVRACTLRDVALSAPHLLVPLVRQQAEEGDSGPVRALSDARGGNDMQGVRGEGNAHSARRRAAACPPAGYQVRARQRVWEAVEAALGLDLELSVEFTGLVGWTQVCVFWERGRGARCTKL